MNYTLYPLLAMKYISPKDQMLTQLINMKYLNCDSRTLIPKMFHFLVTSRMN